MTKLIITGANGKMGKVIKSIVENRDDCEIVAGVDLNTDDNGAFPIYSSINDIKESADAIIDFQILYFLMIYFLILKRPLPHLLLQQRVTVMSKRSRLPKHQKQHLFSLHTI